MGMQARHYISVWVFLFMKKNYLQPLFSYLDNFQLNELYRLKMYTERIYFIIYEEIGEPEKFEFIQKCETNGVLKVLKSLNLYQIIGRGENKQVLMHPKIQLALCLNSDAQNSATFIKDLVNGKFTDLPKIEVTDWINYMLLPNSKNNTQYKKYNTYILLNPENNFIKIGRTKNIEKRISCLNSEFKTEMVLIALFKDDIESKLHIKYQDNRVFGEWFKFDDDTILDIINEYSEILNQKQYE